MQNDELLGKFNELSNSCKLFLLQSWVTFIISFMFKPPKLLNLKIF